MMFDSMKDLAKKADGFLHDASYGKKQNVVSLDAQVDVRSEKNVTPFEELGALGGVKEDSHLVSDPSKSMAQVETKIHGRTLEEMKSKGKVLYGDAKAWYTTRDSKGANHYEFPNRLNKVVGGHIRVEGMYNEAEADYLMRVTDFLTEHGLLTERIRVAWKLNEMVNQDNIEKVSDWKERMLKKADGMPPEQAQEYKAYLETVNLVTVERDLQVAERVEDLGSCVTEKVFKEILGGVFDVINVVSKVKGTSTLPDTERPERFDINNEKDIRRYLGEWLPSQMGIYLARLRKLEMTNDFAHSQNWSLVGTLYDAQSFAGRGFDKDKERFCDLDDYMRAMKVSLASIDDLFGGTLGYTNLHYRELKAEAKANLIKAYVMELELDVRELDYTFFADNSTKVGDEYQTVSFISPSEWNLIKKKVDTSFKPNKDETMKNWQEYIKMQKEVRKKQVVKFGGDIVDGVKSLGNDIVDLVRR